MIQRLFVYGTLAPGQSNEHILRGINGTWQKATVSGALHSTGWGATGGYPAIVLSEDGDEISGFLFSSNELSEHWIMLDQFEGEAYKRVLATVMLKDDIAMDAYLYVRREASGIVTSHF